MILVDQYGNVFGPFADVKQDDQGLVCDGTGFSINIIGDYQLRDDTPPGAAGDYLWDAEHGYVLRPEVREQMLIALEQKAKAEAQRMLDEFAQTREYFGIGSLCGYETDPDPQFAAEGRRGIELRSRTWRFFRDLRAQVITTGAIPTYDDVMAAFHQAVDLSWPDGEQ